MTIPDLIRELQGMPRDLDPYITNGDLPAIPVTSVKIAPADFGQLVLISGGNHEGS